MRKRILISALALAFMGGGRCLAQQVTTGQVTDKAGNPISGARVEAKGTTLFTTTGIDGRFSLETPMPIAKVRVSSMGRVTKTVDVTPNMAITMIPESYWTQKPSTYQFFVAPQLTIPSMDSKDMPFGVMAGVVKNIGAYARFVTSGMPSTSAELKENPNGYYMDDLKTGYQAITGGVIIRLGSPIYLTLGAGTVKRKIAMQHQNGKWYDIVVDGGYDSKYGFSGFAAEAGVMVKFGHFLVTGGSTMWDGNFSTNLGIGYMF